MHIILMVCSVVCAFTLIGIGLWDHDLMMLGLGVFGLGNLILGISIGSDSY